MSKETLKMLAKVALVLFVFYLFIKLLFIPLVLSDQFVIFVEKLGYWGYLVIALYQIASHVFAPLTGTPAVLLATSLYGMKTGLILLYFASLISATINFYLSRKYGRKIIIKLVGKKSMNEVDELASVEGFKLMLFCRVFGSSVFDFLSYAAGLTEIRFQDYMKATVIGHLIANLSFYFIFRKLDLRSEQGITIWIGSLTVMAVIFSIVLARYIKLKKSSSRKTG
ncbi:TVP38/TMEM64 family protein [Candidatus Nomurabacteria bacterium]|nr:TVP38/TMEM64 family protein [Candidatus Nomurabacteria bacterium]